MNEIKVLKVTRTFSTNNKSTSTNIQQSLYGDKMCGVDNFFVKILGRNALFYRVLGGMVSFADYSSRHESQSIFLQ